MTDLENRLIEAAEKQLPYIRKRIELMKLTNARFIIFSFCCDGVYDRLVFDRELKIFVKIEYLKGVGTCVHIQGDDNAGYFSKIETEFIDISHLNWKL